MPLDQKTILDAVKEAKGKSEKRKFTQSVELILNLRDIDMKSPEGRIQELVELPHSPPEKPNKICVIASGELALKARKANADLVIERAELEGLAGKKRDLRKIADGYDFFVAEAPLMPLVGKIFGPVLGPRGKMPVPVPPTADISSLLEKYRKTVIAKMRNQPILQCRVGTESMKDEELADNIQAVLRAVEGKLKKGMKNIKFAYIKTSMGKPVKIKP
ncbi:MAG: 50S ribosomal protein L1 [Candidatus Bathyarchaeota archaeon]|jgi:large subunit ribosomal protein L1|nr:50S ribosomal protein L1 [Candidatus Bathyarchaeota archaeon A05DMB-5]MDH7557545.1 50S ribosomal protein L1 [Candidatus Bathyarchaeota archaeon]